MLQPAQISDSINPVMQLIRQTLSLTAMRRIMPCAMARLAALLASGCEISGAPIIDPKGPVAFTERDLLFTAAGIMLIVIIPVWIMAFVFVTRYRVKNKKAAYRPDWDFSTPIEILVWTVPAIIVIVLGTLVWDYTHRLDPYRPLQSSVQPLQVEVVAQDWKWLFIYPDQQIASVNELVFPSGRPLSLRITSDTVMNSFFIPALGSQIYAMAGMQTQLNLLADEPGRFMGRNMQYSGDGFAKQYFEALATSQADFDAWVAKVRQSSEVLDANAYSALAKPSIKHPVTYYSAVETDLFDKIIASYMGDEMMSGHTPTQ
ncbi:MAG: ubiquinol oxidase subunit II [Pseudomonadota bacterium]